MFGHPNRGPAGHVIITQPGSVQIERETLQCVHCGAHWIREPGSKRKRGFCLRCSGVTCGAQSCDPCVPYEARLEIEEGAKTPMSKLYLDEYDKITRGP